MSDISQPMIDEYNNKIEIIYNSLSKFVSNHGVYPTLPHVNHIERLYKFEKSIKIEFTTIDGYIMSVRQVHCNINSHVFINYLNLLYYFDKLDTFCIDQYEDWSNLDLSKSLLNNLSI